MTDFELTPVGERWDLRLLRPTEGCAALASGAAELEPQLKTGRWLILVVAVWSTPDLQVIPRALAAFRSTTQARLGIRPFEDYAENAAWCPSIGRERGTPIWVFLEEGVYVWHEAGCWDPKTILAKVGKT